MIVDDSKKNTRLDLPTLPVANYLYHKMGLLKVLSWNIHDAMDRIEGPKTNDTDFCKILENNSLFCLQETKQSISVPNFECKNQLRKNSRSGGLCIGIHRSLASNFKELDTKCEYIQTVKGTLKRGSKIETISIINVYDSPEQSSYKAKRRTKGSEQLKVLDLLLDFVANNDLGKIILTGDFNARTKDLNHEESLLDSDKSSEPVSEPTEALKRTSRDQIINSRGRQLLDLLSSTDITLLNGNMVGDIFGEFTSVNYNGCSVVDYIGASMDLVEDITSFKVGDLTKFSDHKPCYCTLKVNHDLICPEELLERYQDVPKKYIWNRNNNLTEKLYLEAQDTPEVLEKMAALQNKHCTTADDVKCLNDELVSILTLVADNVIPRKEPPNQTQHQNNAYRTKTKRSSRMKPKSPWFDSQCILTKRELNRMAKKCGENPTNQDLKTKYYTKKREYKKLSKQKRLNS